MRRHIIWTVFQKELTEALRDWVTLFVLIGLPLVIYPLAILTLSKVVSRQAVVEDQRVFTIAVWGGEGASLVDWLASTNNRLRLERWRGIPIQLRDELQAGRLQLAAPTNPTPIPPKLRLALGSDSDISATESVDDVSRAARKVLASRQADSVLVVWPGFDTALQQHALGKVFVYYDSVIPDSGRTWSRLSAQLDRFRRHVLKERQREFGLPEGFVTALEVRENNVAPVKRQMGDVLGRVLPLLLIMLSAIGAMVAAVDMTAGEKERATMQTLLCAPVRPLEIVAGKFLAVWTISLVSAAVNIASLGCTLWSITAVAGIHLITIGMLTAVLGMLVPAGWMIAALFLAVAVLARDSKDAGNFLGPLLMLLLLPVAATLLPDAELNVWTSFAPLANLSLLIRALLQGEVNGHLMFLTLLSSLAYTGLAIALAAHMFGREQILLGGPFSWRWLLRGDTQRPPAPTPGFVFILFSLVLVGFFYVGLALMRCGVPTAVLVTQYGLLLFPALALAVARRFPLVQTFSLRRPHWRSLVGAAFIGLAVGPAVSGLITRLIPIPEEELNELLKLLQLGDKPAPLWNLWLILALTPALCEESFFRGLMLAGLRRWGPCAAIGISALLFSLLHGLFYQSLHTFVLGLALGYAVWRSGSLYCSILIHALNNGLIATLVWNNGGKFPRIDSVPWSLTLGALIITGVGLALLTPPKRRPEIMSLVA